jgi:hypothetical protein
MWRPARRPKSWRNCATCTPAVSTSVLTRRSFISGAAWPCETFAENGSVTTNWRRAASLAIGTCVILGFSPRSPRRRPELRHRSARSRGNSVQFHRARTLARRQRRRPEISNRMAGLSRSGRGAIWQMYLCQHGAPLAKLHAKNSFPLVTSHVHRAARHIEGWCPTGTVPKHRSLSRF